MSVIALRPGLTLDIRHTGGVPGTKRGVTIILYGADDDEHTVILELKADLSTPEPTGPGWTLFAKLTEAFGKPEADALRETLAAIEERARDSDYGPAEARLRTIAEMASAQTKEPTS